MVEKVFFSINEVSAEINVSAPLLRFWEKELNISLSTRSGHNNKRVYTKSQIETLKKIKRLIREERYSLQGVKKLLQKSKTSPLPQDLIPRLEEAKDYFISLKNNLL